MKIHHNKLKRKGWTEKELKKAKAILRKAEKKKHPHNIILEKLSYYVCLFVAIAGNFLVSIVLIPLLLAFNKTTLNVITLIIGLCFGILFTVLIRDLVDMQKHHEYLYFIVPLVAAFNVYIIVTKYNGLSIIAGNINHNPLTLSIIYVIGFIIPYIYFMFEKRYEI